MGSEDASEDPTSRADDMLDLLAEAVQILENGGDEALEDFLAAHEEQAPVLRERLSLLGAAGVLHAPVPEPEIPDRLGEFVLDRRLGGGGMGVVYLARQTSLQRSVALKLIRPEHLYFSEARLRFRREIEAIAQLQHPNIVTVYSAGEEGGLPYFTMEPVAGVSLAQLLRELAGRRPQQLDEGELLNALARLRERNAARPSSEVAAEVAADPANAGSAARFGSGGRGWVEICLTWARDLAHALDYAHERGVLHRDIKPANVMVTWQGHVLLLDFGLASTRGAPRITRSGAVLGSLPYMAPEQARGEAQSIDRRTDVYALGVTLYEALTLQAAFGDATASDEEVRSRVLQGSPPPLRQRNTAVSWDAETVCLRAMAFEPTHRYASAADFARDLQNVLDLRPIEARRPSATARVRRFVRRRPTTSVAVGMGFLLLVVAPTLFAVREYRLRTELAQAKAEADRAADVREETLRFLNDDLLAAVAPGEVGRDASMRTVLDTAARRVEGRFTDRPLIEAAIRTTIGETYRRLGVLDEAERHLTRAGALLTEHAGPAADATLDVERKLAILEKAQGRVQEAEERNRRILAIGRATYGDEDSGTLATANNLGLLLAECQRFDEAEAILRSVLETRLRLLGEEHPDTLVSTSNLGFLYQAWGKYRAAEPYVRRELELCRRVHGPEHPETLTSMNNWATLLGALGEEEAAAAMIEETVALSKKVRGERHLETIQALQNQAAVLSALGRYTEAMACWEDARRCAADLPANHRLALRGQVLPAATLLRLRRPEAAREIVEPGLAACRAALGDRHELTLQARALLAATFELLGRLDEAAAELAETVAVLEDRPSADLADMRIHHGMVLRKLGRYAEAEAAFLAAHAWHGEHAPDEDSNGAILRELRRLYEAWERPEEAERWGAAHAAWQAAQHAASR